MPDPSPASVNGTGVLILAAGRGTRMRSRLPKVLHAAGGRSLLDHVLAAVGAAGIPPAAVAVVGGYGLDQIRAQVAPRGFAVIEQHPQLGTGHAVRMAQPWWSGFQRLVVLHGDMPLLSAATVRALAAPDARAAALLATAQPAETRPYGRILRDPAAHERVLGIVEDNQATAAQKNIRELNAGFYAFHPAELAPALAQLGTANPHGEFYLTDVVATLAAAGHAVHALPLADADECLGVNDRVELAQIDRRLRRLQTERLMRQGVTIEFPESVLVDIEVEVGEDTLLAPGVHLRGRTRVGANCRVGAYTLIADCDIADGARIEAHCVLEGATVAAGAVVGPLARLRSRADIGPGAHIGNFVEVKNTRVGAGAKANHLAYLGDAQVGARSNVGAGTITCNYDGVNKHPTVIGEGAFIGSNSTLVAPVELGDGAYIAAGSVITAPVPAQSLGLGRARQVNKPDWKRRPKPASS